jgi:hypothetical protein
MYATRITILVRSIVSKFGKWLDHESLQTNHFGPILLEKNAFSEKK